jgi:CDP-glucose 4,6-dehydratase
MTTQPSFRGVRVLVTGHTGFKGAWLAAWLKRDGAEVAGLALAPERNGQPSLFEAAGIAAGMRSTLGDIRDFALVEHEMQAFRPEIVFHLAAQALVRRSYADPVATFATNVMGTAHVLEAARRCPSVRAVVSVTSDKCYENRGWVWGYRENDPLGGRDPYSASKAAAEMVARAYREALLPLDGARVALATARGGNVVGGGDWAEDRLVPDIVRFVNAGTPIVLRNPKAVRPWQHVLELVAAYCQLGRRLLDEPEAAAGAWNFGPERGNAVSVEELARRFSAAYGDGRTPIELAPSKLAEADYLTLDIAKAVAGLGWRPRLDLAATVALTAEWYRGFHREGRRAADLVAAQIERYGALG